MKSEDFVHLHCHSTYSLLEALPTPEEIVLRAKELGQSAVGLADKGYTYGLIEFYQACKTHGMKPILGLETYVAARTRHDKDSSMDTRRYPLTLLAETNEGYANLLELASKAALEGMYYKPRVDAELLAKYGKGLIALSGPISGAIPQAALAEDHERLKTLVDQYRSFFGKDNLYFELMDLPNVPGQSEVNQQLIRFGKELSVPVVASCSSHYCRREDAEAHDVLLCIQKNANVGDGSRFSMRDSDFSMREFQDVERAFSHVPESLTNTRVIADRCNVEIEFGKYKIPKFPVEKGQTEGKLLRAKCEEGLEKFYGSTNGRKQENPKGPDPKERLEYEIGIIDKMGFSGYFLIVADIVAEAKRRGITVGPGRGSAAGSLVSYVLGVTTLDPLEHGLLFERFLNPERISMPDIDIDFADTRRDEVLDYVRAKYGADRVMQICTFGTLAARAAVKDVGRAYGVSFAEMNALAKLISDRPGTSLDEALKSTELQAVLSTNETYTKIMEVALKLEGKARHVSVHACGVVITPEAAVTYTALQKAPKDDETIITQYDAKPLESLGLLKMDLLGLKNLTLIQTALLIIERLHGTKIDISKIPMDDKEAFALLSRGETTGVFQLESGGMRRYLKQLKPTRFEDIVAMCALYRPGPMDAIPDYIKRKNNPQLIRYEVPELEPFLKETYGIIVYQEQVQRVVQEFAGFSLGAGYLLIKAVAKKIPALLREQREKFIKGSLAKGHKKEIAEKIFALIEPFSGYGFNKSHAACYGRVAYETAYLKSHYPTEFMAALLSSEDGDTDRISIEIEEARAMDIEVLPPDINESLAHFTALPDKKIRFGLTAIKGIGESSVRQIIALREQGGKFTTLEDFAARVPSKTLNKKLLESLAKSGALDSLGERGALVAQYARIAEYSKSVGDVGASQTDMFGSAGEGSGVKIAFDPLPPATPQQKLLWEKETLGLYVSSHPLAGLKKYVGKKARLIESLTQDDMGKKITVAGIVEQCKVLRTKKGDSMAIVTLEDPTGKIEATLFPRTYAQIAEAIEKPDTVLVLAGTLEMRMGQSQLKADAAKRASLTTMIDRAKADGMFDATDTKRRSTARPKFAADEHVESVTEEGDVIVEQASATAGARDFLGPVSLWIIKGMDTDEPMEKLGLKRGRHVDERSRDVASQVKERKGENSKGSLRDDDDTIDEHDERSTSSVTQISVHTIQLPERAPKQMLLQLKGIFETFPGREKVQLKIGEKVVPVGMTITMSPILEKRVDELVARYSANAVNG